MKNVLERFLTYISIDTQSNETAATFPSTDKQKNLAHVLVQELIDIGIDDVYMDETYGYVYAHIAGNQKDMKKNLGFIAHMDTSPEVSGANVCPQLVKHYDGKDIVLNAETNTYLRPTDFPELHNYIGKTLVTTDGTTLLGADDKAGIAEIMSMAAYLMQHPEIKHGNISIAFTPDEEVGGGMEHFDVKRFDADYAYTVDGGALGELEYENFNAAKAVINFTGRSVHPGDAKGKMLNASLLLTEFIHSLPSNERPETTEGYEGFYHLTNIQGCVEHACAEYIIRDHDTQKFEQKKSTMLACARNLNQKYHTTVCNITITDQYYNMQEKIKPYMFLIHNAVSCMKQLSIEPVITPIRGGTDGARLSFMGIPCPNLCTGGHNFHGRYEYCCVESMEKITELLILLAQKNLS